MNLESPFYRLPLLFDAEPLAKEVEKLPAEYWLPLKGGASQAMVVPLIVPQGDTSQMYGSGPLSPMPVLDECLFLKQVLESFQTLLGKAGLVKIPAGAETTIYDGADFYGLQRLRIYVPITTAEEVRVYCNYQETPMPAGETWVLDSWGKHTVTNPTDSDAVYLVATTMGSPAMWDMVGQAQRPLDTHRTTRMLEITLDFDPERDPKLSCEEMADPPVMNPWQMDGLLDLYFAELRANEANSREGIEKLQLALRSLCRNWQGVWARFGDDLRGEAHYRPVLAKADDAVSVFAGQFALKNGVDAVEFLRRAVLWPALRSTEKKPQQQNESVSNLDVLALDRVAADAAMAEQSTRIPGSQTTEVVPSLARDSDTAALDASFTAGAAEEISPPKLRLAKSPPKTAQTSAPVAKGEEAKPDTDPAKNQLRAAFSKTMPEVLQKAGITVMASTYQAGRLVLFRDNEGTVNTHLRRYPRPMGIAFDGHRLALGTNVGVWEFHLQRGGNKHLEPAGKHDACFVPRAYHLTGNISVHEMAWAGPELWIVNTRFSCLCTLNMRYSFEPRWRPPFISGLAAEDRCHLNGLCVVDGKPKYVTALGKSDHENGWRENKAFGGILMDIESNEIIAQGLSMPHSPRFHDDKLWVLESGAGSLSTVDLDTGKLEHVALLPGFTRGIDFLGPYAFIGLSQVRESAVFSGIPITERTQELVSGIAVVDIRNGNTVAFIRFDSGVHEIFAVTVLRNMRYPEIVREHEHPEIVSNSWTLSDEALKDVQRR